MKTFDYKTTSHIINFNSPRRPQIVCLSGSDHYQAALSFERTIEGSVVLSTIVPIFYESLLLDYGPEEARGVREVLSELARRKIEMADTLLVLNPGGVVLEESARELEYALSLGKKIELVEPLAPRDGWKLSEPLDDIPHQVEDDPRAAEDGSWVARAYFTGDGWLLYWDWYLRGDYLDLADYLIDEWPFPVDYATERDLKEIGFEIV